MEINVRVEGRFWWIAAFILTDHDPVLTFAPAWAPDQPGKTGAATH